MIKVKTKLSAQMLHYSSAFWQLPCLSANFFVLFGDNSTWESVSFYRFIVNKPEGTIRSS